MIAKLGYYHWRQEHSAGFSVLGLDREGFGLSQAHVVACELKSFTQPAAGVAEEDQQGAELMVDGTGCVEQLGGLFRPQPAG